MTIKRLFKSVREKLAAEKIAAGSQTDGQNSTHHRRTDDDASK
jgi:hypothetical protein